jgi:hypothetical protein
MDTIGGMNNEPSIQMLNQVQGSRKTIKRVVVDESRIDAVSADWTSIIQLTVLVGLSRGLREPSSLIVDYL